MRGPRGPHRHRRDGALGGGGVHRSRSQKAGAAEAPSQTKGKPTRLWSDPQSLVSKRSRRARRATEPPRPACQFQKRRREGGEMSSTAHAMLTLSVRPSCERCVFSSKESQELILSAVARRRNSSSGSRSLFWTQRFQCAVNFGDPPPKGGASVLLKLFPLVYHTHVFNPELITDSLISLFPFLFVTVVTQTFSYGALSVAFPAGKVAYK